MGTKVEVSEFPIWTPFPTGVFPEPLAGYVAAAATAIGCDEAFVALPLLAAVAGAIGNARRVKVKRGWEEPAAVWVATVGESGSQKSPGWEAGLRPVFDRQKDIRRGCDAAFAKWKADHARWKADHAEWKRAAAAAKTAREEPPTEPEQPSCPALWIDDATIEAVGGILAANERGTLVAAEELAGWFGGFDQYRSGRGNDAAKWLRMFGGRELRIDRKMGTPKTLSIPYAAVSIAGTIQPGVLRRHLGPEQRESGMASRLLFAWPPPRQVRWTDAEVDPATKNAVADLFARLYGLDLWTDSCGSRRPALVPLSADAKPLFRDFVNAQGEEHASQTGDLAAAYSKLTAYAARFALLFALVRRVTGETIGPDEEVDAMSMADGITLARWFTHEARRVYRLIDAGEAERERHDLMEFIRRKGGRVTPRDLMQGIGRFKRSADDALAALKDLEARGLGRVESTSPGPRGGRPGALFTLPK